MMDPYKILRVNRSASAEEIQSAYRKLVLKLHPDRNPGDKKAEAKFKEVQAAWEILGDASGKARFDATGDTSEPAEEKEKAAAMTEILAAQAQVMNRFLDQHWSRETDLLAEMRMIVSERRGKALEESRRLANVKKNLERLSGRFVAMDGGENPLQAAVENNLDSTVASLGQAAFQIAVLDRAIAELKRFGFKMAVQRSGASAMIGKGGTIFGDYILGSSNGTRSKG